MADPDEALIEAIAEALRTHNIECTGLGEVTCRGCRELGWMPWPVYRKHVARAMVAHLGLVEEVVPFCDKCGHDAQPACPNWHDTHPRRLVSRWTEVDHGSE